MFSYSTVVDDLTPEMLGGGFFAGWPNPPTATTHLATLRGSSHVVLARREGEVVGFVNAISDGVMAAYIPLLEVLPAYQGQGVGTELLRRLLELLAPFYMVDVGCDPDIAPFYDRLGLRRGVLMFSRNYASPAFAAGANTDGHR